MSLPRFHLPPNLWRPGALVLTGDEARHCTQVMRRGDGDEVIVFNGIGAWARCRITAASKDQVDLVGVSEGATPALPARLTLLQAIPKAGNMELIIEKAVELGVHAIHPVFTERTVVKLDAKEAGKKRDKWQRLALESCKQCGQNWLPQVHLPCSFPAAWTHLPSHHLRLIAALQEDARPFKQVLADPAQQVPQTSDILMAIGPEGDFTPGEYAMAREHGCHPVSLGPIILRVETAALFCLSVLSHELRVGREHA